MKNILITGGAGFIGSHLTINLVKKGYNITILDNLSEQVHGKKQQSRLYDSVKEVSKILIELGIEAKNIKIIGKGESDLRVKTKDEVAHPANRRAEISPLN